jgi:hypothetical protein
LGRQGWYEFIGTYTHQTRRHLTPLSKLGRRSLDLLEFPVDIYTNLCADSFKLPLIERTTSYLTLMVSLPTNRGPPINSADTVSSALPT